MIGGPIGLPIGGVVINGNFTLTAATGTYTFTGNAAAFVNSFGNYALAGQSSAFTLGVAGSAGAFTFSGNAATLTASLAASTGPYTLSGNAALATIGMPVNLGAYALTGGNAILTLRTETGTFTLSGSSVTAPNDTVDSVLTLRGGTDSKRKKRIGTVRLADRKITITNRDGTTRKVGYRDRFKPPPPLEYPPDWLVPQTAPVSEPQFAAPILARAGPALPNPPSIDDLRDESDLLALLAQMPDPLVESIKGFLAHVMEGPDATSA